MKTCKRCKLQQPVHLFNKNRRKADGLDIYRKPCCKLQQAASYAKHREKRRSKHREWAAANPEKMNAYSADWRKRNPQRASEVQSKSYRKHRDRVLRQDKERRLANLELFLERERQSAKRNAESRKKKEKRWRAANPHKVAAYAAARRAALSLRVPKWLTEQDYAQIDGLYAEASRLTTETGVIHHVDHVLPLRGRFVSGLHVPQNMRVMIGSENLRKSNNWTPS